MSVTSTMLALGTKAPGFSLPDISGESVSLDDFDQKALLVAFICNHCPYVGHVREGLVQLGRDYKGTDAAIVAIASNDPGQYPEDGPEGMKAEAATFGYEFPYLYDETQEVAAAYTAMCTPDFFLFDGERELVYRGRFDGSRPNSDDPVTGEELRAAIEAVLHDQPVSGEQYPSMGCNIKWRPGNEPPYYIT